MDALASGSGRSEKSTSDRSILRIPAPIRFAYRVASRLSPVLGAEMARQLMFHPPRGAYREEQTAVLAAARTVRLPVRGGQVQAYRWGSGPAVMLLHGWGGHAGHMAAFVAPLTEAGYEVIALDAPAHGRSAGRLSSIVHFADAMHAAASAFGPFAGVVAHSMGAAAAIRALDDGLPAARAVLIAPQARLSGYWRLFSSALGMTDADWTLMRTRTERWLKVRYDDLHPDCIAPRMTAPLLILHGEADRMTPIAEGERLAGAWPGARMQRLDCGHLSILRDERALAAATAFIRG